VLPGDSNTDVKYYGLALPDFVVVPRSFRLEVFLGFSRKVYRS